jgi:medium-chain acyl-[acyl-carrier-protein] hydrolase
MESSEFRSRFLAFQPNSSARLRLFCLPSAGGGGTMLQGWLRGLPPSIQVCPFQLPGRENRWQEPVMNRLPPLITHLADAIEPLLEVPFVFFGHSLGALLAFELARELRRRGRPGCLKTLASARIAPQETIAMAPICGLSEPEFVAALQARYNAIPDVILADREMMALYLPVLRADLEMIEKYVYAPEPPLACPITVFGGTDDPTATPSQLAEWRQQTSAGFKVRMFPGDHFFPKTSREAFVQAVREECQVFL